MTDYRQLILDSGFSSHELCDAHRACGSKNPPDYKAIWEWLNDHTPTVGETLEFWQSNQAAAIAKRRQ